MSSSRVRTAGRLVIAATAVVLALVDPHGRSWATVDGPVDAGAIEFVDPDTRQPMESGDSNSVFSFGLPLDAACPGDSANDDWRVQSFLIPASDDPGALEYGVIRADGDGRFAVYTVDTRPYMHFLTEQNGAPGLPGRVDQSPRLTFAVFPAGTLPAGNYRLGVACTYFRETARYWDTEIVIEDAADVHPGQFRWRLAEPPSAPSEVDSDSSVVTPALLVTIGLAAAGALWFGSRRRRSRPNSTSSSPRTKEPVQ